MSFLCIRRGVTACLFAAACASAAGRAHAQTVSCSDVGGANGHRVYLSGSTALAPLMATVGRVLAMASSPLYLIYDSTRGSCDGVHAMLDASPAAITGTARYYDPSVFAGDGGAAPLCTLAPSTMVDIGLSDVYQDSCADFAVVHTLPATIADFFGPNQVMTFVVPAASSQKIISRDAAYLVFGFGGNGQTVAPWTDSTLMYVRSAASGTQSMISAAIGVPPTKWAGMSQGGSGAVVTGVNGKNADSLAAESTIGILAADFADANRPTGPTSGLTILAFQHTNQNCAYYPDSTPTAFDKINVRDGHYPIWGPAHFLTRVDGNGRPTNADVATVLNYITTASPTPELVQAEAAAHVVPQCAMKVRHVSEVGPYVPYKPAHPCGCFFEKQVGAGASCAPCSDALPCSTGQVCSYGYCEAM
jgi:ABC-type phosphate transport system substrate-binding protein